MKQADLELAQRLQREEEEVGKKRRKDFSPSSEQPFDADLELARRLQREEEEQNKPHGVKCQLCSQVTPIEELFILDVCTVLMSSSSSVFDEGEARNCRNAPISSVRRACGDMSSSRFARA